MRARFLIAAVGAIGLAMPLGALQVRDGRLVTVPVGTGSISGLVRDSGPDQRPVGRALIMLTAGGQTQGLAVTDDQGRFRLDRLPAGQFSITATKPAYLQGAFGATLPGRAGVPIVLAAGQHLANVTLTMARGAAIGGSVRLQNGEPAADSDVSVYRIPPGGGEQTLVEAARLTTDDHGAFRAYGLMPGEYVVAALLSRGRTSDVAAIATAEMDRVLESLRRRTIVATPSARPEAPSVPASSGSYTTAPVFYPGVTSPADAGVIALSAGDERTGVDFAVRYTRTASVEGTIQQADGSTPPVQMAIITGRLRLPTMDAAAPRNSESRATATGTFKYTNFVPGRYVIAARTPAAPWSYAQAEVDVASDDVQGLALVLQPAMRLTGRVVFAFDPGGFAPADPPSRSLAGPRDPHSVRAALSRSSLADFQRTLRPPADLSGLSLRLDHVGGTGGQSSYTRLGNFPAAPASVSADGRFEFSGILPGRYRLTATVPGETGWWARSAIAGGRDLFDGDVVVTAGRDLTDVVVTFADRRTEISGTLQTATGGPVSGLFIVAIPADRSLWQPASRRIRSTRSGTDSRWTIRDLPPGDYLVGALSDVGDDDLRDRAFLEALAAAAVRVTVGDGASVRLDLRIGGSRLADGNRSRIAGGWQSRGGFLRDRNQLALTQAFDERQLRQIDPDDAATVGQRVRPESGDVGATRRHIPIEHREVTPRSHVWRVGPNAPVIDANGPTACQDPDIAAGRVPCHRIWPDDILDGKPADRENRAVIVGAVT
jgi:hypothetical protein